MPTIAGVRVREAFAQEVADVGALTLRAYVHDGLLTHGEPYAEHLVDAAGRARDATLLVAVETTTGAVVGTVTFAPFGGPYAQVAHENEVEFRMLAVAPEARGRGVGEALVADCMERAHRLGARRLVLSTATAMEAAARLYDRMGFVRLPERDWSPVPGVALRVLGRDL